MPHFLLIHSAAAEKSGAIHSSLACPVTRLPYPATVRSAVKLGFYLCFLKQDSKRSLGERQTRRETCEAACRLQQNEENNRKKRKKKTERPFPKTHLSLKDSHVRVLGFGFFFFLGGGGGGVHFLSEYASCERVCEGNVSKANGGIWPRCRRLIEGGKKGDVNATPHQGRARAPLHTCYLYHRLHL